MIGISRRSCPSPASHRTKAEIFDQHQELRTPATAANDIKANDGKANDGKADDRSRRIGVDGRHR
ncbi:hypothetical protein [Streptomyces kronopolitis]|uniref:hypothetical protein n=1 Tax=Streptomyces kronopolitis TaxID=1612435 RepID=UPI0020BEB752|nr:hypothetical protein [Streptomyces kronopolitis]MCL6301527.1 hypothetical protein [Streptomyces kronopolitis]